MRQQTTLADELVALADEKGALFWKAYGMMLQGLAARARRPDLRSDPRDHRRNRPHFGQREQQCMLPLYLSYLARAYAELGQFDDAWRCIGEAMTAVETTKERWCEAEIHRMAGEIALMSPRAGCGESGSVFRACARGRARAAGKVLGAARGDEHGAAVARSGQAGEPAIFSLRSTAGSPKASTRSI